MLWLLGCILVTDSEEERAREAKIAQIQAENANLQLSLAEERARSAALAERLAALEDGAAVVPGTPTGRVAHDPETGEVYPLLTPEQSLTCAWSNLEGIVTAQLAYDAAFDEFAGLDRLGWAPERSCGRYLAFKVVGARGDFTAQAVITAGENRGRRFRVRHGEPVREIERLSGELLASFIANADQPPEP